MARPLRFFTAFAGEFGYGVELMKRILITFGIAAVCFSESAVAQSNAAPEIVTSCGESNGHVYYHHNSVVSKAKSGWTKDRVKNGYFFVQKKGEKYDLIYPDPLGLQSASDNGALIVSTHSSKSSLNLIVIYPENGNTEVYNFQHLGSPDAEASWTSTKVGTLIVKSGVFYSKCKGTIRQ